MGALLARLARCEQVLAAALRRIAALEDENRRLKQAAVEVRSVQG